MEIYTIGFTRWSASRFFGALAEARIQRLIDVRLKNDSQLTGFSRKRDLPYFLQELVGAAYTHETLLAPTDSMLSAYRDKRIGWEEYESEYRELLRARRVDEELDRALFFARTVLLCSEHEAAKCHRRLIAEYLAERWGEITLTHL